MLPYIIRPPFLSETVIKILLALTRICHMRDAIRFRIIDIISVFTKIRWDLLNCYRVIRLIYMSDTEFPFPLHSYTNHPMRTKYIHIKIRSQKLVSPKIFSPQCVEKSSEYNLRYYLSIVIVCYIIWFSISVYSFDRFEYPQAFFQGRRTYA